MQTTIIIDQTYNWVSKHVLFYGANIVNYWFIKKILLPINNLFIF